MDITTFTPSALHLFGGCGGLPKGFEDAGIVASVINEMEANSAKTLRMNFPHAKVVEKPIQECLLKDWGGHWFPVHSYTYPCERYSDASSINGTQTGDELYLEALREGVLLWPEVIAIENVIGMEKFPRVMETWRNLPGYFTTEFRLFWGRFHLATKGSRDPPLAPTRL
jgi:DNA (cytosine-5)-methyltransferase 1